MIIEINFSNNWNSKLNCDVFTTLRLASNQYKVGNMVLVKLKGQPMPHLACIKARRDILITDINDYIAGIDTGLSADKCRDLLRTMYKNYGINWHTQRIAFLLIAYSTKPSAQTQKLDFTPQPKIDHEQSN